MVNLRHRGWSRDDAGRDLKDLELQILGDDRLKAERADDATEQLK